MLGETVGTVTTSALHSVDSGSHTCSVTDYAGRSGNDTVTISITGEKLIHDHISA